MPRWRAAPLNICIGCGCDDVHACMTSAGPCSWLRLDAARRVGVCSGCRPSLAAWDAGVRTPRRRASAPTTHQVNA